MKKLLLACFLCLTLASQSGCVLTAVGIAATGVATTMTAMDDEVEMSYPYPYWCVFRGVHTALEALEISISSVEKTANGDIINAATKDYPIVVTLTEMTPQLVKVSVAAGSNVFQLDTATATAILEETNTLIVDSFQQGETITTAP